MKNYIYGKNTVYEMLEGQRKIYEAFVSDSFKDEKLLNKLQDNKIKVKRVSAKVLDKMVDQNHQGIIIECEGYTYANFDKELDKIKNLQKRLVLVLDGIEDPHNLGSIIRSAEACQVDFIVIGSHRCCGVTPTVDKVSTGATSYVLVCQVTNISRSLEKLKQNGFWVVCADMNTNVMYDQVDYDMNTVIVMGSEGKGVSSNILKNADFIVKLPMFGRVNSLNVSVATGIMLYEVKKGQQRK